jgi:hypothetical protein
MIDIGYYRIMKGFTFNIFIGPQMTGIRNEVFYSGGSTDYPKYSLDSGIYLGWSM